MSISISHGTLTQVQSTLSPASGYTLPSTVTVVGATSSYSSLTGEITLTSLTSAASITAAGVAAGPLVSSFTDLKVEDHTDYITVSVGDISVDVELAPAPSGYSGNIQLLNEGYEGRRTCIKFDSAPTSATDYDAKADNSTITGLTSYSNKTKVYVWTMVGDGYEPTGAIRINDTITTLSSATTYNNAREIALTGNYTIYIAGEYGVMPVSYYSIGD